MRWLLASIGVAAILVVVALWPWSAPRAASPTSSATPVATLSATLATDSAFAITRALAAAGFDTAAAAEAQSALKAHPEQTLPPDLRYLAQPATSPAPRPSPPQAADSPFAITRALAAAGFDTAAATEAQAALKAHPGAPLPDDLRYLTHASPSRDPFAVAKAQVAAGLDAEALETAKEALRAHPDAALPPELKRLFDDPFSAARGLAAAGLDKEAGDSLREALKAKPNSSVPPELVYLVGQPIRGLLDIENQWTRLGYAITVLAALLALGTVAWLLVSRVRVVKLRIQSFEGPASDSSVGSTVAALIEDDLAQLQRAGRSSSLVFVASPDQQVAIELLKSLPAQFSISGLVATAVNLIPSNVTVLSGRLHPAGEQGLGVTAKIARPYGGKAATRTLWEKDIDPLFVRGPTTDGKSADKTAEANTYYRLAVSIAAWALHELPLGKADHAAVRLMTADSQSYQFFRAGALWHQVRGDRGTIRARRLYLDALHADTRNTGALLDLALLDAEDGQRKRAISRLLVARSQIESKGLHADLRFQRDRMWYRATYSLAAALLNAYADEFSAEALRDASQYAKDLIITAIDEVARVKDDRDLRVFLKVAELSTLVLLATAWTYRVQEGSRSSGPALAALGTLRQLPLRDEQLKTVLNHGPSLAGAAYLIRVIQSEGTGVSYRVHYNLACYYSVRRKYDRSLDELRYGLEHGNLGSTARGDPTLRNVRQARTPEFAKVVRESEVSGSGIAGLYLVGADLAVRLDIDHQIKSLAELRSALNTESQRAQFAADYDLKPSAVQQIWDVAELAGVAGIGQENAISLVDAGVTSISALESREPAAVVALMHNVAKLKPTATKPTLEEVTSWINEARRSLISAA